MHRLKPIGYILPFLITSFFVMKASASANLKSSASLYKSSIENVLYSEVNYITESVDSNIATVIIHPMGSELDAPIIELKGGKKLVLRFDDLGENFREMNYEFEHCTFDWKPSELDKYDFQEGYDTDIITDYRQSFNTITPYTNYFLEFPNDRIDLKQSGNYIVRVYADGNKDNVMLTARFMVVETASTISANIQLSRNVSNRDYDQEVDVGVNLNRLESLNPYAEIELVVVQNQRWDNAKYGVKPSFSNGQELIYNYQDQLTFHGINEFRFLDGKSVKYRSEQVAEVIMKEDGYHIIMAPDISRAFKKYSIEQDINGKLLIQNDEMYDAHTEADYINVYFTMPVDALLGTGKMYLFGQLSNWNITEAFELEFNLEVSAYQLHKVLKQGYYNYLYLWQPTGTSSPTTDYTEGNHSETENDYEVYVYFKDNRCFCHRLVGYKLFNSFGQ